MLYDCPICGNHTMDRDPRSKNFLCRTEGCTASCRDNPFYTDYEHTHPEGVQQWINTEVKCKGFTKSISELREFLHRKADDCLYLSDTLYTVKVFDGVILGLQGDLLRLRGELRQLAAELGGEQ